MRVVDTCIYAWPSLLRAIHVENQRLLHEIIPPSLHLHGDEGVLYCTPTCQRCAYPSRLPACFWRQQAAFPTLPFRRSPGGLHVLSSSFGTDAAWLSWCSFSIDCVGLKVSRSFIDGTRAGRITVTELLTRSTSTAQGAVRTGDKSTSGRTQTAGTAHSRSCRRS